MSVNSNKKILDASKLSLILSRLASQIFENHLDFSDVVLIGIQPRGKILSQKICNLLNEKFDVGEIKLGFLDITFFRDDFGRVLILILIKNIQNCDLSIKRILIFRCF